MQIKYSPTQIEKEALELISKEVTTWENAQCFVTDKISYNMRDIIKRARKNYYGVFDSPYDEATGREKIWVPLTETTVEQLVKNIDIDTKDINVRAKNPKQNVMAEVDREILRDQLKQRGFGEILDEIERIMTIDGTCVVKTWKSKNREGKDILKCKVVDNLNFFIDPYAHSIEETDAVTERVVMPWSDFENQRKWINKDKVVPTTVDPTRDISKDENPNPTDIEIYNREGWFSKFLMTGNEEDREEMVFGVIIASGVKSDGGVIHKIMTTEKQHKSYDECWLTRVPGRWYGRGVPEKLFALQSYLNEIANLRINNSRIFQTGLFKARKGRGITQRSLHNLISGGVLLVDDLNDIEQFQMNNPALGDSLQDEGNIRAWAADVTQSREPNNETLPASTPATTVAIQNQNNKSAYSLIQEGLGMFLQRLISRQWIPILKEIITPEDILRISGNSSTLAKIDSGLIDNLVNKAVAKYIIENFNIPDEGVIEMARTQAQRELAKQGKERYFKAEVFLSSDFDVEVFVTNEDFDKNTILQNLMQIIGVIAKVTPNVDIEGVVGEMLDIMGLGGDRFIKQQIQQQLPQVKGLPQGQMTQGQNQPAPGDTLAGNQAPSSPGQLIAQAQQQAPQGTL